jgi:hypothetical protein
MRVLTLLAFVLCFVPSLSATVLLPAEFREIVAGSQIIVHGRVTEVRSEWVDGRRRIESLVTVEPATFVRGTPTRTVTFRVAGGQIGRYKSMTVGAPAFAAGEEVVLFLKAAAGPAMPRIFGMNQGVFRVRLDARGQRMVSTPPVMARSDAPEPIVRGAVSRRPLPLEQFTEQVRAVLQQGGAR